MPGPPDDICVGQGVIWTLRLQGCEPVWTPEMYPFSYLAAMDRIHAERAAREWREEHGLTERGA